LWAEILLPHNTTTHLFHTLSLSPLQDVLFSGHGQTTLSTIPSRLTLYFHSGVSIPRHSRNGCLTETVRISRLPGDARPLQASLAVARSCHTQTCLYDRNMNQKSSSSLVPDNVLVAFTRHDASGPRGLSADLSRGHEVGEYSRCFRCLPKYGLCLKRPGLCYRPPWTRSHPSVYVLVQRRANRNSHKLLNVDNWKRPLTGSAMEAFEWSRPHRKILSNTIAPGFASQLGGLID
jgi:hypothetical protein